MVSRGMGIWRITPSKEVKSSLTQYVGHPFLVVSARSPLSHPSVPDIGRRIGVNPVAGGESPDPDGIRPRAAGWAFPVRHTYRAT